MTLPIFPNSPVWADITTQPLWNEEVTKYDSGMRQGSTPWSRPLHRYTINGRIFNEVQQSSLRAFWNSVKGMSGEWLIKDPYDYNANAVVLPISGLNSGDVFNVIENNSYQVLPDSGTILITDSVSGALNSGVDYVTSLDNGTMTILGTPAGTWTASFEFFRKVAFDAQYTESSNLWNIFSTGLVLEELLP